MHLRSLYVACLFFCAPVAKLYAQDTLPRITVRNISNKVIISWRTTYGAKITNINIQRSEDSIKNFTTIGSVLEPNNRENGFVDNKVSSANMFYRVFVSFYGGSYVFTKSYRPAIDTVSTIPSSYQKLEDMVNTNPGFIASRFVYTGKDNNVILDIPDVASSKYSIKFFDVDNKPVFEISKITEPYLIIEKVNFSRSGWFYFKLYENGIIKEQKEFYIPREGKYGIPPDEIRKKFK